MQQGAQTDATCNIQQCWELLANNVAFVCMGLKSRVPGPLPLPHVFAAGGRVLLHLGKSSIDGLVFCFVIIPCQLVFVWLFLVSVLTYRAASGALAVLSSSEKVCNQIIKVLLSNILYPSYKRFSTTKRAREFSTPLYYYAWHRATRSHEARGSGDENGFYAASAGAQNSARDRALISFLRKPNVRNKTLTDIYLKRNSKRNCNGNKHTMNVQ